jgi:hypothetical protein
MWRCYLKWVSDDVLHYKKFFYYRQIVIHGFMTMDDLKSTEDLPTIKPSIKLRICYELFEIVTHCLDINNYWRHKIIIVTHSLAVGKIYI